MKLTNYIRDAFITAVMQDVPKSCDHSEEIRKIAQADLIDQLPQIVQKAWKDKVAIEYIKRTVETFGRVQVVHPCVNDYGRSSMKLTKEAQIKVDQLASEMQADRIIRDDLTKKLKGAAYACTTTKQLRELLPEFERYLPAEEEKTLRTLPAVANIMADFAKAGWPAKKETKVKK